MSPKTAGSWRPEAGGPIRTHGSIPCRAAGSAAACFLCLILTCGGLGAGEAARNPAQATERGLAWLRTQQQADGGLSGKNRTANTALAVLAHLSAGVTPDLPEYGPSVRRMLVYLAARGDARGYLGGDGSRMYGHGMACLALANALGTSRDDDLDERLRLTLTRAIAVTVTAARISKPDGQRGGWRYQPDEAGSEVSVTGWQLSALYAARRTGLAVPDEVFSGALAYMRGCIDPEGRVGYTRRGEDHAPLRGLALLALGLQPGPRDALRDKILARMRAEPTTWSGPSFFFRVYYEATGLSRSEPAAWPPWRDRLFALLIANQGKDGSWPAPPGDNERDYGAAYATALALLALTVELRLLPSN